MLTSAWTPGSSEHNTKPWPNRAWDGGRLCRWLQRCILPTRPAESGLRLEPFTGGRPRPGLTAYAHRHHCGARGFVAHSVSWPLRICTRAARIRPGDQKRLPSPSHSGTPPKARRATAPAKATGQSQGDVSATSWAAAAAAVCARLCQRTRAQAKPRANCMHPARAARSSVLLEHQRQILCLSRCAMW